MKREELFAKTKAVIEENKEAFECMYEALSKTQKSKMDKHEKVQKAFKRHGVKHGGGTGNGNSKPNR